MKRLILVAVLLLFTSSVYAEDILFPLTRSVADARYCLKNGVCSLDELEILGSLIISGNLTIIGQILNITVTDIYINATHIEGLNDSILDFGNDTFLSLDNSNQPLWTPTTTKVTNLNADLLDGYNTGTSGATIPVMNTLNTWGNTQLLSTSNSIAFRQTTEKIYSDSADQLTMYADKKIHLYTGQSLGIGDLFLGDTSGTYIQIYKNTGVAPAERTILLKGMDDAVGGGGGGFIKLQAGKGGSFGGIDGQTVINDDGIDVDTRIEGDTETNLFTVNAGFDSTGINSNGGTTAFLTIVSDVSTKYTLLAGNTLSSSTKPVVAFWSTNPSFNQPVVELQQADVSEGFIDFIGSGIDAGFINTTQRNVTHSIRVEINGVKYLLALYEDNQ